MQAKASSLREQDGKLRVLLVEYDIVDQMAVLDLLKENGYGVEAVENWRDASVALEERRFDILLLDVQPPEINSIRAIAAIRKRERVAGSHLPIVAFISQALAQECEGYLQVGMDACVSKPIQSAELLRTIEGLTKSRQRKKEESFGSMDHQACLTPVEANAFTQSVKLLAEIQAAIKAGDVKTIHHSADALKGSITSVLAKASFEAASTLEKAVHEDDLARARDACRRLRKAIICLNSTRGRKTED